MKNTWQWLEAICKVCSNVVHIFIKVDMESVDIWSIDAYKNTGVVELELLYIVESPSPSFAIYFISLCA
jgi:hypothetical protein